MSYRYLVPVYFLLLLPVMASRHFGFMWGEYGFKPLLMPVLAAYFYLNVPKPLAAAAKFILAALFFSWLGDLFLMFQPQLFLFGLVSFLLAHLMYINAFVKTTRPGKKSILRENPWLVLPFAAFELGFLWVIYAGLGGLLLPVIAYATIIISMCVFALNRYGRVSYDSFNRVFTGALLFTFSDCLIAVGKFYLSNPPAWLGAAIMLTYCLGQFNIVSGMIMQLRSPN